MQFVEHWKTSTTLQNNLEILRKALDLINGHKKSPQPYHSGPEIGKEKQIAAVAAMPNSEQVNTNVQALSIDEANNLWNQAKILNIAINPDPSTLHDTQIEQTKRLNFDQLARFGSVDEDFEDFIFDTGLTTGMDLDMAYDINSFLQAQRYRD